MSSTSHIAGPALNISGRTIQRCSLCGEKLIDDLRDEVPTGKDGGRPATPTWTVGRLVRVSHGNPTAWTLLDEADKLPEDSCISLVEE